MLLYYRHAHLFVIYSDAPRLAAYLKTMGVTLRRLHVRLTKYENLWSLAPSNFLPILELQFGSPHCGDIIPHSWRLVHRYHQQTQASVVDFHELVKEDLRPLREAWKVLLAGNETWRKAVLEKHLSQIIMCSRPDGGSHIRFVYRVGYELPWMRTNTPNRSVMIQWAVRHNIRLIPNLANSPQHQGVSIEFGVSS